MRVLLGVIFALGTMTLSAGAQESETAEGRDSNAVPQGHSSSELQYKQLRDLITEQAAELESTRQQLRQLQQRMDLLESSLQRQSGLLDAKGEAAMQALPALNRSAVLSVAAIPSSGESNSLRTAEIANTSGISTTSEIFAAFTGPQENRRTDERQTDQQGPPDSIRLANGKVRIGTVMYGDFAYYAKTGFGPQFTSQASQLGPGNNGYNTFEVTRAYINLFYSPNNALTFRLTPDLYRQIGAAPATKLGKVSAIGPNTDQGLPFRLKYAYIDFNALFAGSEAFKANKLTIGQQPDPVIEWEEGLYGYRYVNIVPWDYLGYGASWAGMSLHGPVEFNAKQYLDYSIGVYNNASYRLLEQSEKKHAAARLTYYPLGARWNYDGLGFTGFYDYGYTDVTPDSGVNFPVYRVSATAHYTFKKNAYEIAGEIEAGRNAFTSGNFFSGSAPQDEFGLARTEYAGFDALVKALQNTNGARQRGYAAFGHAQMRNSPFSLFGMYQSFFPNTNVAKNPIDFERIVAGIGYKVNDRLRFAVSSQNLVFQHSQFTFPVTELEVLNPSLAIAYPNGIPNAVPDNVHAIFLSTGFSF